MGILPHVLHPGARPIRLHEFIDAVRATCTPRFPKARGSQHRPVGLAISGGVDSMALAFLCIQLRQYDSYFKVSDNPVANFRGLIVDHGLRDGSRNEANAVSDVLRNMGIYSDILPLSWTKVLGDYEHPNHLPNLESVARRLRYRKLGYACAFRKMASLFLAHHEDDQYETVLMRLVQGHGSRGLRGMRRASDIPECEGEFGASQSGYVDDQNRHYPYWNNKLSKKQRKALKREMRSNIGRLMVEEESLDGASAEMDDYDLEEVYHSKRVISLDPFNVDVEDGGVMLYRPLLEFGKDRLIATCLENKIPWWEDHTNQDSTLTMRNAVRHLYKGYTLPAPLQKPSILGLAYRCERKAHALDAEANRLLTQTVIDDFEPNIGSVLVQFPNLAVLKSRRHSGSSLRREARTSRLREIAGLLIQKVLALVTPESQPPPLANLQNVISRLFPALSDSEEATAAATPKAFNISSVHFMPIKPENPDPKLEYDREPLTWYLSRAPYPSNLPLPRFRTPFWSIERKNKMALDSRWKWSKWLRWTLWDGRFWIRMTHRLPYRTVVQPFVKEHAKVFRELLPPADRDRLAALLKRYAPGKVRYTLPAIYLEEDLDLDNVAPRKGYPNPPDDSDEVVTRTGTTPSHPRVLDDTKMKLIALPTLDIQLPKLDQWLSYEVRYRRADRSTLETADTFHRGSFVSSKLRKKTTQSRPSNARRRRIRAHRRSGSVE